MRNDHIPLAECPELFEKAVRIYRDDRIGEYQAGHYSSTVLSKGRKEIIEGAIIFAQRVECLTQRQMQHIGKLWDTYQRIVALNASFDGRFVFSAIGVLDDAIRICDPYTGGKENKSLQIKQSRTHIRREQIARREYFWDVHISPARGIINHLKSTGVECKSLDMRVSEVLERVRIELK